MDILTILSTPIPAYFTLGPLIILLLVLLALIMKKSPASPGIAVIPPAQVQIQQPQVMSMPPVPVVQAAIPIISSIPVQPSTPITPSVVTPIATVVFTPMQAASAPEVVTPAVAPEVTQIVPTSSVVEKIDVPHVSQAPSVATTPITTGVVPPVTSWQPATPVAQQQAPSTVPATSI